MESGNESLELLLDSLLNSPLGDEPGKKISKLFSVFKILHLLNVFMLILVGDFNLLPTRLQLDADSFTEPFVIRCKCQFERISNVVIPIAPLVQLPLEGQTKLTASTPSYDGNPRLHLPCLAKRPSS